MLLWSYSDHREVNNMAVSVSTTRVQFTGNASTTAFTFTFPIGSTSELKVYEDTTLKSITTHYTVAATNNSYANGGVVTFVTAPASGVFITIAREMALTSGLTLTTGDTLPAETLQSQFDDVQKIIQELADKANMALQIPVTDSTARSNAIDKASTRANTYLGFDANGDPETTATISGITLSTGDEGWTNVLQTADEKKWVTLAVSEANLTMANSTAHNKVSLILVTTGNSNRTILMPPETATGVSNIGRRIAVVKMDAGTGQIILQNDAAGSIATNVVNRYDITQLVCLSATEWASITENPVVNLVVPDAGTIGSASDADAIAIGADGDVTLTQDLELQHDGATISFGGNDEVSLTHVHDTGLLLNGTMQLQFNDASQNIQAPSAAILDINATDEIELNATLADVNANLDVSGTGVIGSATDSTSTTSGALTVVGGLGIAKNAHAGNFKLFGSVNPTPVDFGVVNNSTGFQSAIAGLGTGYGECAGGGRMVASYPAAGELVITFTNAGVYLLCMQMGNGTMGGNDVTRIEFKVVFESETNATVVDLGFSGNGDDRIFALTSDSHTGGNMSGSGWYNVTATAGQLIRMNPQAEFTTSDDGEDINQKIFTAFMVWG